MTCPALVQLVAFGERQRGPVQDRAALGAGAWWWCREWRGLPRNAWTSVGSQHGVCEVAFEPGPASSLPPPCVCCLQAWLGRGVAGWWNLPPYPPQVMVRSGRLPACTASFPGQHLPHCQRVLWRPANQWRLAPAAAGQPTSQLPPSAPTAPSEPPQRCSLAGADPCALRAR